MLMLESLVRCMQDLKELWEAQTYGRSNYKQISTAKSNSYYFKYYYRRTTQALRETIHILRAEITKTFMAKKVFVQEETEPLGMGGKGVISGSEIASKRPKDMKEGRNEQ